MQFVVLTDILDSDSRFKCFRRQNDARAYFDGICDAIARSRTLPTPDGERHFPRYCRLYFSKQDEVDPALEDVKTGAATEITNYDKYLIKFDDMFL